jgi:hypothetical protein
MISASLLEEDFNTLFKLIGFNRVDEQVGKSPTFHNADYISRKSEMVVELKIIEKDFFKDGGMIDSLNAIVPAGPHPLTSDGLLLPGVYNITIPSPNREGKHDNFEEPLRRSIKKANSQLKETRHELLEGKGYGVIVIALHMPTLIDIHSVTRLVDKLMHEFTSITGYLVCAPAMAMIGADVSCIHGVRHDAPPLIEQVISEMGDRICEFFYLEPKNDTTENISD